MTTRTCWLAYSTRPHCSTRQAIDLEGVEDLVIWNYALSSEAIIVTKDEDFAERRSRTTSGPTIIWLRIGNSTNRVLLEWLQPRWAEIIELLDAGNRLIEVR